MLTLDVKTAFDSAPLGRIISTACEMRVPKYLEKMIDAYFHIRTITVTTSKDDVRNGRVERCVPQGSVLGSDLGNIYIRRAPTHRTTCRRRIGSIHGRRGVDWNCDNTVFARRKARWGNGQDLTPWIAENWLELAMETTEAALLTNRNHHNHITVTFGEHRFE